MELTLKKIKERAISELKNIVSAEELKNLKNRYLGRKSELNNLMKEISSLAVEEKPKLGALANVIKKEIADLFQQAFFEFGDNLTGAKKEIFDITLPGYKSSFGHLHPITQVRRQLEDIFKTMGFRSVDGPEIESEYYNFEVLNVPASHPARDMQDTFYVKDYHGTVMRTHTSNQQVRALQQFGAPLRAIFPGRVFRCEATDASHEATFYQMEGIMVDKNISIANLIAVMRVLLKEVFGHEVKVRLRPGYFPFVEPGFELDMSCLICAGRGCSVCKNSGWVETMPCGLVHPRVLEAADLNPSEYSGFAFGLGLSRLTMMKYGINDIRLLLSGDLRFLYQF